MIRLLLTLLCGFLAFASAQTWRPSVLGRQWAVASGHPQASMAAVRVLEQGGNAIDAAVAATLATTVVEPMNVSIGGHGMVMIYLAKTGQVYCIDGSGWTGKRATADRFDQKTGGLPFYGPLLVWLTLCLKLPSSTESLVEWPCSRLQLHSPRMVLSQPHTSRHRLRIPRKFSADSLLQSGSGFPMAKRLR